MWLLRIVLALTAVAELFFGDFLYGLEAAVALGICLWPAISARSHKVPFPIEIEILLLLLVIGNSTLGLFFGFYDNLLYYDKFLHFINPVLITFVGFLILYVMYFTGRLQATPLVFGVVLLLVTLGLGGVWEIAEYASDSIFGYTAQGSPTLSPFEDTMWDMALDLLGVVGAIVGSLYIRDSRKTKNRRFDTMMSILSGERPQIYQRTKG